MLALLLTLTPVSAVADRARTIETSRITVGQIAEGAPDDVAGVDLGRAPAPGGVRVLTRQQIARSIRESGFDVSSVKLPSSVRVKSAAKHIQPDDFARLARPAVERALPKGVTLTKLKVGRRIVVSPRARVGRATVARLPKRVGSLRSSGTVQMVNGGEVVARVPVAIIVDVSGDAARPDVQKGRRITLVIQRRSARISMQGVALKNLDIGDIGRFTVARTGRVVKAKVLSRQTAAVWGGR